MKSVKRNGCVYPEIAPLRVRLKYRYEAIAPPLRATKRLMLLGRLIFAMVFKAPRLYTHEEKARKGAYFL